MNRLFTLLLCLALGFTAYAQTSVTGRVVDETGQPLPGVSVLEKGTTNGSVTNVDGKYAINVADNATIVYSFIGYITIEQPVGGRSTIDISMESDVLSLDEVVVTALGVKKEKKALGYSVQQVDGEDLTEARDVSFMNSLQGQVAGVQIQKGSGGPSASTRVTIRGNSSLTGSNEPLYVVDGIPIDNTQLGSAGMWGGRDEGDGISSINPDDIETISVLKGPTAAALYGNRGQNGVVLITTKKGKSRSGVGVELNSNIVFENIVVDDSDLQYEYGAGEDGVAPADVDEAILQSRSSWGERFNGQTVVQPNGESAPYVPIRLKDNLNNFYRTGVTTTNTLVLSGGNEMSTYRFSASWLNNESFVPESGLDRYTIGLRTTSQLSDKLSLDVKINAIREKVINRPALSDSPHNPGLIFSNLANSVNSRIFKEYEDENGEYIQYFDSPFRVNPYWGLHKQRAEDDKDRIISTVTLNYKFTDWLSLRLRGGIDKFWRNSVNYDALTTPHRPLGGINNETKEVEEVNTEFLLSFNKNINQDISVSFNVGGNHRGGIRKRIYANGSDFALADFYHVSNTVNRDTGTDTEFEIATNSLFAFGQVGYKNMLFLDVTGRKDWFSTLPLASNSIFYPSVSTSFVFTDAFAIGGEILSFGKIRAAFAKAGNDAPYAATNLTYRSERAHNGLPGLQISNGDIPNGSLKPEETTSIELGADLRFFEGRLGIDFAYYKQETSPYNLKQSVPWSTGYDGAFFVGGKMENKGIELLLTGNPVQSTSGFRWDVTVNFSRNQNTLLELAEGLEVQNIGTARSFVTVDAVVGEAYGTIQGLPYRRTPDGTIMYDTDGTPLTGQITYDENGDPVLDEAGNVIINNRVPIGNAVPDWIGGITNSFSYKGLSLSALIDIRKGGDVYSMSNLAAYGNGSHINTLVGREAGEIVGEGVQNIGTDAAPEYTENTVAAPIDTYYGSLPDEQFVYDGSYVKLRQLIIGYTVPQKLLSSLPFQSVRFSIVGRNLHTFHKNIPIIDPESTYSTTNGGMGLEYGAISNTRTFGFNLNIKF